MRRTARNRVRASAAWELLSVSDGIDCEVLCITRDFRTSDPFPAIHSRESCGVGDECHGGL
jgi:hypothetical protein